MKESEKLLAESIERLKAEIEQTKAQLSGLNWTIKEKEAKLRKLSKIVEGEHTTKETTLDKDNTPIK